MTPVDLILWALALAGSIIIIGLTLLLVIAAVKELRGPTKLTNVVQLHPRRKKSPPDPA